MTHPLFRSTKTSSYPHFSVFSSFHPIYILLSQILSVPLLPKKEKNKMDKYIILSPEAKGTFNDRLNFLYLKLGNYLDTEKLENRTLQYCKVFLSDAQNQTQDLEESLLYQEYLKDTHLTVVEQPPLNGSKISLLIKTTDDKTPYPVPQSPTDRGRSEVKGFIRTDPNAIRQIPATYRRYRYDDGAQPGKNMDIRNSY